MKDANKWTRFMAMHSGGGTKEEPFDNIYIEAPQEEAEAVFYSKFGHNPNRVSCTCCGADYSIDEHDSLAAASAYERNCYYDKTKQSYVEEKSRNSYSGAYQTLAEYTKQKDVKFIYAKDITDEERGADVPTQGYVWEDGE